MSAAARRVGSLRIVNTLFRHNVYSGLHELFKAVAGKAGCEYIICDDVEHGHIRIGGNPFISRFNYVAGGRPLKLQRGDIVITRSIFNTSQPFRYRLRGMRFFIAEESWGEKPLKRRLYKVLGRTLFRNTPFISQTPKVSALFDELGVRYFYSPPFLKPAFVMEPGKHVLYVARMELVKKPELVIELAKMLPQEKFVIVGSLGRQDIRDRIKKEAESLPNVEYMENLPYEKLLGLYGSAKVLILPTLSDPIGYCVAEALSKATPVITTTYAGTADFLKKEWVLGTFEPVAWKKRIEGIAGNQRKSRIEARECFMRNNLELGGPYFQVLVERIAAYLSPQKAR